MILKRPEDSMISGKRTQLCELGMNFKSYALHAILLADGKDCRTPSEVEIETISKGKNSEIENIS